MVQICDTFTLQVTHADAARQYTVPAKTYASMVGNGFLQEAVPAQQLAFTLKDSIGILTVHSFSASAIKKASSISAAF